jgi:hypothetical protein
MGKKSKANLITKNVVERRAKISLEADKKHTQALIIVCSVQNVTFKLAMEMGQCPRARLNVHSWAD